ncbi:DUF3192 domain-containing protein [Corallincola platygyrae]|uniref:DUF3192 domain-containing protein n=1 Tax=Corallincola platygyrae TaxID=1193278 RepID=A0ABW4XS53_9GAMM
MKKLWVVLALLAPLSLSGCVIAVGGDGDSVRMHSDWEDREHENRKKLEKLDLGMALTDVRGIMGTADFDEKLAKEEKSFRILYYRTQRQHKDGITSKSECTPLVFENGSLVGWGNTALERI